MPATVTNRGLELIATENVGTLDIRTACFKGTAPAVATMRDWNFLSEVIASALDEAAVSGYSRQDLAGLTVTEVDANDNVTVTATAPTLTAVAAGETWTAVAHYVFNASDAAAELIMVDVPASTLITNGGNVTLPQFSLTIAQA